ncbi:MAG: protein kinase [Pirellulaceae bacterium]|nr:protein kinase [Pirellulaceae bacterium]
MNEGTCPDDQQLQQFATESLGRTLRLEVLRHVGVCDNCRERVRSLSERTRSVAADGASLTRDLNPHDLSATLPRAGDGEDTRTPALSGFQFLEPVEGEGIGRLGEYLILDVIGQGGMGVVFRAIDERLQRFVAIKVLAESLAADAEARAGFLAEARAAAAINHPNVVTIHGVQDHADVTFIVMEYVEGESLRDCIKRRGPLPLDETLMIAAQVAIGLADAHKLRVVHRDIKPGNILLKHGADVVKIADFGLAQVTTGGDDDSESSNSRKGFGTPAYMSPEQAMGELTDERTDLFSLGCVLYAMLAGESPFRSSTNFGTARRVAEFEPPPLKEAIANCPPSLSKIVVKLLAKRPSQRYETADEVAALLQRELNTLSGTRTPTTTTSLWRAPLSRGVAAAALWALTAILIISIGTAGASKVEEPEESVAAPPVEPTEAMGLEVTVSQDGGGDYVSIVSALADVKPGDTVRVIDSGTYAKPLVLNSASQFANVTLEATNGATLATKSLSAISIENTPGVTVRGFRLEFSRPDVHGVTLIGDVPGALIEDISIHSPIDSNKAGVQLVGAAGTIESPIVIRDLYIRNPATCICLGGKADPVRNVRILGNSLTSPELQKGVCLILEGSVYDVVVRDNRMYKVNFGLSVLSDQTIERVIVENNTFQRVIEGWFAHWKLPEDVGMSIHHNMILESSVHVSDSPGGSPTFEHNVWELKQLESPVPLNRAQHYADVTESVPVFERDPGSDRFLLPDEAIERNGLPVGVTLSWTAPPWRD